MLKSDKHSARLKRDRVLHLLSVMNSFAGEHFFADKGNYFPTPNPLYVSVVFGGVSSEIPCISSAGVETFKQSQLH